MTVRVSWTWVGTILHTFRVVGAGHGAGGHGSGHGAPGTVVTGAGVTVVAGGMAFGSAFGITFSWPTAANGTTARSAPAKTRLRTLNMGTSPFPKWSPAVVARCLPADARHPTPTFDVHGQYSRRGQEEKARRGGKGTKRREPAHDCRSRGAADAGAEAPAWRGCAVWRRGSCQSGDSPARERVGVGRWCRMGEGLARGEEDREAKGRGVGGPIGRIRPLRPRAPMGRPATYQSTTPA